MLCAMRLRDMTQEQLREEWFNSCVDALLAMDVHTFLIHNRRFLQAQRERHRRIRKGLEGYVEWTRGESGDPSSPGGVAF